MLKMLEGPIMNFDNELRKKSLNQSYRIKYSDTTGYCLPEEYGKIKKTP
jgi:hypothetical protein